MDIADKLKQKCHMKESTEERLQKLQNCIHEVEIALYEQTKLANDLQSVVSCSQHQIQHLQRQIENISSQLGDATLDTNDLARIKRKTEIVQTFKQLFPGVVSFDTGIYVQ